MQDANINFYVENPARPEIVDFDKENVTVIDGAIYSKN